MKALYPPIHKAEIQWKLRAMTYTGRLINEDAQVSIEGGPILAVPNAPNPIATAAGQYAVWGQTQRVTVTGVPGTVDNIPVLYVTSIQWAASSQPQGSAT